LLPEGTLLTRASEVYEEQLGRREVGRAGSLASYPAELTQRSLYEKRVEWI